MTADSASGTQKVDPSTVRKAVGASAIGNATEWYDYGVYAYVAVEIGNNFFPGEYATLGALLVFAVSFILRPLGGLVWGPLGDRLGRTRVLAATIMLMSGATFLVGLLPNFESIGIWAPILLVLLRVVQGFSTGGEYGGAATFMAEYAPDRRRGFWGSFLEFGTLAGFTLAVVVVYSTESVIGPEAMAAWGWRVPFMLALPLGLIGLYLRTKIDETPCFQDLGDSGESGGVIALKDLITRYRNPVLQLFGLVIALNVINYTLLAYMPTYLKETIGMDPGDTELLVIIGQVAMMVVIPFAGALSDRIGRKPCWWISLVGMFVLAVPMFMLMRQGLAWAIVGFTVLGLIYVLQLGTISATFPAMFPTHVRYTGMAASYNIATALFGGTAPAANEALKEWSGSNMVPAFYMMGSCVIGMVALYFVIETKGASLRGREVPGVGDARPLSPRGGPGMATA